MLLLTCVEFGDVVSFLPDEVLRYGRKFAIIDYSVSLKKCFLPGMQSPQRIKLFLRER